MNTAFAPTHAPAMQEESLNVDTRSLSRDTLSDVLLDLQPAGVSYSRCDLTLGVL
jgi:hypothetical protein